MNPFYKNLALWMVIGLVVVLLFNVFGGLSEKATFEPNYSDFLKNVDAGLVQSVTIRGNLVTGKLKDGGEFRTYVVESQDFVKLLRDKNVKISVRPVDQNPWYMSLLISWFPMILFIGVWIFFMRQMQGGGAKALSFGKARARLISEKHNKVTFVDVAGVDEAKEELREIIEFLKDPQKFQKLGGKIPKGVLAGGATGNGQDPAGEGDRRRGERAVLLDLGLGLRRDVRRRRRLAGAGSCSSRARSTPRASSSWTRSTRSGGIAAPVSAAATTSGSRPSTSSSSRWTGSRPTRA
jgi:hypothetical protein